MGLLGLDTVCAGSSLALSGLFYYLYRKQRAAVLRIQAAPRLQVNADLRTLLETSQEMNYVVLEGRVEAIGKPLHSENQFDFQAVIQKHQMIEHRLFWNNLTRSWSEYVRVIRESVKEIPFHLSPLEGNDESVLVCDPLNASGLMLQTVHERFHAASLGLGEVLGHYLSGEKPTGLLETEEILPVGVILTGMGRLSLKSDGEMTLGPPEDGSEYFLSLAGYDDILHQQESIASFWRGAAFFLGALSAVFISLALYRAYRGYKERNKREGNRNGQEIYHSEYDEESVDIEKSCLICISRARDCVILPCGHVCCCFQCYQTLPTKICPICRGHIERVVPLFQT